MLIGLGFAVALLLALVVGRFAWNTALGFSKRRRNQQVPAAVLELQTDRDRLRAEHAMLSRKLELRLDDLKSRLVEQMAEVSRNRNRIHKMADDLERQTGLVAERDVEVAALRAQKLSLEEDVLVRSTNLQTANDRLAVQEAEIAERSQSLSARDLEVAELKADIAGLPQAPTDFAELPAEERLKRRIEGLAAMSGQIAEQRQRIQRERRTIGVTDTQPTSAASLTAKLLAAERDADELSDELKRLDESWSARVKRSADAETPEPAAGVAEEPEPIEPQRGLANVISLAQRIRSLKQDLG